MSNSRESVVMKEVQEIRALELSLEAQWGGLVQQGKPSQVSFLASVIDLKLRAHRLERLLDSPRASYTGAA